MFDMGLLIAFLLLVGVAVALVLVIVSAIRSHRGRGARCGAPSCGHCGYNLTGAPGNRCPECGRLFIEAGVTFRFGERSGRSIRLAVGAVVLLLLMAFGGILAMRTYTVAQAETALVRAAQAQAIAARDAAVRQARQAQYAAERSRPERAQ